MRSSFPKSILFALMIVSIVGLFGAAQAQERPHFVIDAGHGGNDTGTRQNGIDEKDLTLDLAKRVSDILRSHSYSTTMTRDTDVFMDLVKRAEVANKIKGSIFVSLHFNSHSDRSVSGLETFYWPGSVQGQKLASYIQGGLHRRIVTRNRGFKPKQLKVLEATKGTAALVECGFISNRKEAQRSETAWFKQVLAKEIAHALIRYSAENAKVSQVSD